MFPDLLYVDLPIRSQNECRKLLENITDLPSGMFCAGYLEGGRDACNVTYSLSYLCIYALHKHVFIINVIYKLQILRFFESSRVILAAG